MAHQNLTTGSAISGLIGNVICYEVNGQARFRCKPGKPKNPQTQGQLTQRMKFKLMQSLLKTMRPLLKETFAGFPGAKNGYDSAMAYNLKMGLTGIHPNVEIQFDKTLISFGNIETPANPVATKEGDVITITWDKEKNSKNIDKIYPILVKTDLSYALHEIDGAYREEGSCSVLGEKNSTYHVWLMAKNNRNYSNSVYLGAI